MPNAPFDPSCPHTPPDGEHTCSSCGRPILPDSGAHRGGRLVSFAQAVRLRAAQMRGQPLAQPDDHTAAARRCLPIDEFEHAPTMSAPIAAATGPTGPERDPPNPPVGVHQWDPRHRVALLVIAVAIFLRSFARLPGSANPSFEILAMGLMVAVQYALLLWPFSGRTVTLINASLIAILIGHRAPGRDHLIMFYVNLVLLAASVQAVLIGFWRSRRQRREHAGDSASPS